MKSLSTSSFLSSIALRVIAVIFALSISESIFAQNQIRSSSQSSSAGGLVFGFVSGYIGATAIVFNSDLSAFGKSAVAIAGLYFAVAGIASLERYVQARNLGFMSRFLLHATKSAATVGIVAGCTLVLRQIT